MSVVDRQTQRWRRFKLQLQQRRPRPTSGGMSSQLAQRVIPGDRYTSYALHGTRRGGVVVTAARSPPSPRQFEPGDTRPCVPRRTPGKGGPGTPCHSHAGRVAQPTGHLRRSACGPPPAGGYPRRRHEAGSPEDGSPAHEEPHASNSLPPSDDEAMDLSEQHAAASEHADETLLERATATSFTPPPSEGVPGTTPDAPSAPDGGAPSAASSASGPAAHENATAVMELAEETTTVSSPQGPVHPAARFLKDPPRQTAPRPKPKWKKKQQKQRKAPRVVHCLSRGNGRLAAPTCYPGHP
nr:nascent polypeptide-associated complex subunit alpha, muscle-specific form-like [Dermacentor andersoni]